MSGSNGHNGHAHKSAEKGDRHAGRSANSRGLPRSTASQSPFSADSQRARRSGDSPGQRPVALAVRPATPRDAVPLGFFFDTVLRKDYFLRRGQLADMLRSPYHQVYVAEIDTILVGIAVQTRGTRLVNVLVHPGYRGLGIGRALVQHSGATEVRAKIDMSTGDPRGFYAALGFEPAGPAAGKRHIEVLRRGRPTSDAQDKEISTPEMKAR